jgi:nucleotide-binding universal stress UspA family protein
MFKLIKSILFATDLSEKCIPAFDFAVSLAIRYQATIVLLHVTEKLPGYIESRLKGLLGEQEMEKVAAQHEKSIRESLIAKKSSNSLIQAALEQFCSSAGIDDDACGYHSREVVIRNGEVVDEIISQSEKYACDLILLASRKGLMTKATIGSVIKDVLRRSDIPVLVVPPGR